MTVTVAVHKRDKRAVQTQVHFESEAASQIPPWAGSRTLQMFRAIQMAPIREFNRAEKWSTAKDHHFGKDVL
jgi:hypothetical protein